MILTRRFSSFTADAPPLQGGGNRADRPFSRCIGREDRACFAPLSLCTFATVFDFEFCILD